VERPCYFCGEPIAAGDRTAIVADEASAHEACWRGAFGLAPAAGPRAGERGRGGDGG